MSHLLQVSLFALSLVLPMEANAANGAEGGKCTPAEVAQCKAKEAADCAKKCPVDSAKCAAESAKCAAGKATQNSKSKPAPRVASGAPSSR
ncbi:MAG: hypothetical protein ABIT01_07930 [Thermoanaerobaculia bacterium]